MGHLVHIASLVGVAAAVHHFWPKGVTYGEREDWEKQYRSRRYSTSSSARITNAQGWYDDTKSARARETLDKRERERRRDRGDRDRDSRSARESSARPVRERDIEYGAQPVYSRHAHHHHHHHHRREYDYDEYDGGDEEPRAYSRRASMRY